MVSLHNATVHAHAPFSRLPNAYDDLLSDRYARPISEHSRGDVHGCQFLEQQLGCVRDVDLCNLCLVLAGTALEGLLGEVPV